MLGQMYLGSKNTGTQDEKGTFSLEDPARSPLIVKRRQGSERFAKKGAATSKILSAPTELN